MILSFLRRANQSKVSFKELFGIDYHLREARNCIISVTIYPAPRTLPDPKQLLSKY